MSIEINILASGSRGNCMLIKNEYTAVLLDAGISARRITAGLKALHMDIKNISAISLTHEHTDHTRGLKTLLKKNDIPIYTRAKTFKALPELCTKLHCCRVITSERFDIGSMQIRPFSISHDAADPVGFKIKSGDSVLTTATDLGFVSDAVKQALEDSDAVVLEANHDINMLQNGAYPWPLKQRILGKCGHLSNFAAGTAVNQLQHKPQHLILAHLSEKNNTPQLAQNTIGMLMQKYHTGDIPLQVAGPDMMIHLEI